MNTNKNLKISTIGIGNGGCNIISYLANKNFNQTDLIAIDTNLQSRARKGGVGYKKNKAGRNQHYPIRAYSFELGSERFPREINENLVAGLKVKFKGITVKF